MEKHNLKLLLVLLGSYLVCQFFGLASAKKILDRPEVRAQIAAESISIPHLVISLAVVTLFILLFLKFVKHRVPYKIFFGIFFFLGVFYTLSIWLPIVFSLAGTILLFYFYRRYHNVVFHNLIIGLTIVWASCLLGLIMSPWQMVIVLILFSIYDVIAVCLTGHMVKMFTGLAERGVTLALIIPTTFSNLGKPVEEAGITLIRRARSLPVREWLFLGTGDIALPMVFAVSVLEEGIWPSILVIIGAAFGIIFIHSVLARNRKPLPALPSLAAGAILGWMISKIFY